MEISPMSIYYGMIEKNIKRGINFQNAIISLHDGQMTFEDQGVNLVSIIRPSKNELVLTVRKNHSEQTQKLLSALDTTNNTNPLKIHIEFNGNPLFGGITIDNTVKKCEKREDKSSISCALSI